MSRLEHALLQRLPTIQHGEGPQRLARRVQDRSRVGAGELRGHVEPVGVVGGAAQAVALAVVALESFRTWSWGWRREGEDLELESEGFEGLEGGVGAEVDVGDVEVSQGVVVVTERVRVLSQVLG